MINFIPSKHLIECAILYKQIGSFIVVEAVDDDSNGFILWGKKYLIKG